MVKLNVRELETTFGEGIKSESRLAELMGRLIAGGAESVFLTQGKDPAYLLEGENLSKHVPPQISQHRRHRLRLDKREHSAGGGQTRAGLWQR